MTYGFVGVKLEINLTCFFCCCSSLKNALQTCLGTVFLSFLCKLIHHLSFNQHLITLLIVHQAVGVHPDFPCCLQHETVAGAHGAVAPAFDGFQFIDQRVVPVFVVCFECSDGFCAIRVLLNRDLLDGNELGPLVIHVQDVHLHHCQGFLLFQI